MGPSTPPHVRLVTAYEAGQDCRPDDDLRFAPYRTLSRADWAKLRAGTPMTLAASEIEELSGIIEPLSVEEVEQIYLPLSRLLNLHVAAAQKLDAVTSKFLGKRTLKVPFIIGVSGSVAVGKSTTARVLRALLARWPNHPRVDLITTDGFLYCNDELKKRDLMNHKGFPESFDRTKLLNFLIDLKSGHEEVEAPVYSHFHYDILDDQKVVVKQPDIVILEGLNVLQSPHQKSSSTHTPLVSDFLDFSIYIDAEADLIRDWYLERFMRLRTTAFRDPAAYFHRYAKLSKRDARKQALNIWETINLKNLNQNILPTRERARLILHKREDHQVHSVALRKL